jgi:hypothetical protein
MAYRLELRCFSNFWSTFLISVLFPIIGFIIIFPYYRCRLAHSCWSYMIIFLSLTYKAVNYKQLCLTLNVFIGHIFIGKHFFTWFVILQD